MIEVSGEEGIQKRFRSCLTLPGTHNLGEDRFEILGVKKKISTSKCYKDDIR